MVCLIIFFLVTITIIYISNYYSVEKENRDMLARYVKLYSLEAPPGGTLPLPPGEGTISPDDLPVEGLPKEEDIFLLSSFYSTAFLPDGTVAATDAGRNGLYSDEDIVRLSEDIMEEHKEHGRSGNMMYMVEEREGYTLVAFMDTTLTENSMSRLLSVMLIAGGILTVISFAGAVVAAKKIIRPLEENDVKQKRFISDAGHELKTPISVVDANVEILSRQIGENKWLSNIKYESKRMNDLIKELLELSRAENGNVVFEEIDLSGIVERETLSFEGVAFEKGYALNSSIEKNIVMRGNGNRLGQLVSILADNAVSHSKGAGSINIELKRENKRAVLKVSNPGEKIDDFTKEHLFERFYRADRARTDNDGHFGLGLSIAKAIVDAHGGKIQADFFDGEIIFSVSLPALKI